MERKPRPLDAAGALRADWVRLCVAGLRDDRWDVDRLSDRRGQLRPRRGVHDAPDDALAVPPRRRPAGPRSGPNTIFRRDFVPGATQLRRYGFALAAMILVTEIGFLQRIFSTVDLTLGQWGVCLGIALTLVVVEEIIKVVPPPAEAGERPDRRRARARGGLRRKRHPMSRRERILKRLVVEPGTQAGLAERDPAWTGGKEFEQLSRGQAEGRGEGHPEAGRRRSSPTRRSSCGRAIPTRS